MLTLSSPSLLEHVYSEATAPLLLTSNLDSSANPEDRLLQQLLGAVEAEARRLASRREPGCHYEADQYMVIMKNRVWNSMSLVQARLNEALNRRVPIARLPDEILGNILEFYIAEWYKEYRLVVDSGYYPPSLHDSDNFPREGWSAILQVCQMWRRVATHTPTLFTNLDLDWHHDLLDFFLRCNGRKTPLFIHIPSFSPSVRASVEKLSQMRNLSKAELLRVLIARTQELNVEDVISLAREFPDGLEASAPQLRSLTMRSEYELYDPSVTPEHSMTDFVESGDLRKHLFRDMAGQLQTLSLTGFGFTKDWLPCVNLKAVSICFQVSWYEMTRGTSPFFYLAELPNLEILYFSDKSQYCPAVSQLRSVLTFNRLHTLTFSEIVDTMLRSVFTWLNLPALRQFTLLCGYERHNHHKGLRRNDPFFAPWECSWLDMILESATHIRLLVDVPSVIRGFHERENSGAAYATLMFMESASDEIPLFKMTLDKCPGLMSVKEDSEFYEMIFATMTHCLRQWVLSITSMLIIGIGSQKTLPPTVILRPLFKRCHDLTSLTVENCDTGRLITALSSVDVADVAAPGIRELRLQGCSANAGDLESLSRERETLGFVITQIQ